MQLYTDLNIECCAWLASRVEDGSLPAGDVLLSDVRDLRAEHLRGYAAVHLFAGIGGFPLGLQWARQSHLDGLVRKWYCEPSNTWEAKMAGKLKKLTESQAKECVRLYEAGSSLGDIASYFGVSRQAMWDLVRRRTNLRSQRKYGSENHFHRGGQTQDELAHDLVESAVRKGILVPQPCESCGTKGSFRDGRRSVQAHHDDYNKPLDVRWLCQKCHHQWHKTNKAKRKEEPGTPPSIMTFGFP